MQLGHKKISNGDSAYYVIAEIGVNHEGNIELARRLIDLAREGGADAVKLQAYKAEKLACRISPSYWDNSKEPTKSQYDLFKKYDCFEFRDFQKLFDHCEKIGIDFLCTPFDFESVNFLKDLTHTFKIASADLTNVPLLRKIGAFGKPVLLSTGASSFTEVDRSISELKKSGCSEIGLLHCVLNYPTETHNGFLSRIPKIAKLFPDQVIGYSDHISPGDDCFPLIVAYLLGARIIEKHFTHDKSLPGNDHYHAMNASDLKRLKIKLEEARSLMGTMDETTFLEIQGAAIKNARRSIVASRNISVGSLLTEDNLTVKRPAFGIAPTFWDDTIGSTALRDIPEDTPLNWSDFQRTNHEK